MLDSNEGIKTVVVGLSYRIEITTPCTSEEDKIEITLSQQQMMKTSNLLHLSKPHLTHHSLICTRTSNFNLIIDAKL